MKHILIFNSEYGVIFKKGKEYEVILAIDEDGNLINLNNGIFVDDVGKSYFGGIIFNALFPSFLTYDGKTILLSKVIMYDDIQRHPVAYTTISDFKAPPLSYYREQKIKTLLK